MFDLTKSERQISSSSSSSSSATTTTTTATYLDYPANKPFINSEWVRPYDKSLTTSKAVPESNRDSKIKS